MTGTSITREISIGAVRKPDVTSSTDGARKSTTQAEPARNEPVLSLPSLNALFANRVKTMTNSVFLCVPSKDPLSTSSNFAYNEYTFEQFDEVVNKACRMYAALLPPRRRGDPAQVVALFASSGFDYAVSALAICRLGHTVAFLSTNNSCPALAHLIKATAAQCVLYGAEQAAKIPELKALLLEQGQTAVQLSQWITVAEASEASPSGEPEDSAPSSALSYAEESSEIAFIVHSSGSTGFPKPILIS